MTAWYPPPDPSRPAREPRKCKRHRWVFDSILPGGMTVYHCDDHDPPLVRHVNVNATWEAET